jgi:tol-pal system protein YbgF
MRRLIVILLALAASAQGAELSTSQRLDLLERRIGKLTELTMQLDELRRENRALRGETERLGFQLEQLERRQRDLYLDIDQRLGGSAGPTGETPVPPPAPAGPAGSGGPPPAGAADRQDVEAEYKAAYALLSPQKREYAAAADAFAAFLQKYPSDPLAANAQYWLGEALYVSQRNQQAQQAFEAVVERYPDSGKVPGALYKLGRLHEVAGSRDAARRSYQAVAARYPDSPAAGLARQALDALGP